MRELLTMEETHAEPEKSAAQGRISRKRAARKPPEPLPRTESRRRLDLTGELSSVLVNGQHVLRLNDSDLIELLSFALDVRRNSQGARDYGRVHLCIERASEE